MPEVGHGAENVLQKAKPYCANNCRPMRVSLRFYSNQASTSMKSRVLTTSEAGELMAEC